MVMQTIWECIFIQPKQQRKKRRPDQMEETTKNRKHYLSFFVSFRSRRSTAARLRRNNQTLVLREKKKIKWINPMKWYSNPTECDAWYLSIYMYILYIVFIELGIIRLRLLKFGEAFNDNAKLRNQRLSVSDSVKWKWFPFQKVISKSNIWKCEGHAAGTIHSQSFSKG